MAKELKSRLTKFDQESSSLQAPESFEDYVSRELIGLSVMPLFNTPLTASAATVAGENKKFGRLSGSSQAAVRELRHTDSAPCKFVGFNFLEQGEGRFRQGHQLLRVRAGEGVMYDADLAYTYSFEAGFRQSVILVPHHYLQDVDIPTKPRVFSFYRPGSAGRALLTEIRNVLRTPEQLPASEQNATELLPGLMPRGYRSLASYRLQALDLIGVLFTDPTLNGETVSTAMGISERHLRRAFADEEGGVGRAILRVRLEAASRLLTEAHEGSLSILEVAVRCGFGSLSYFSREFKKLYGTSPRDYRRQSQQETGAWNTA